MATIEKRTGRDGITYRVKVRRKGCVETATFGTKQEAMVWAHQSEARVLAQGPKPLKPSHTVAEAIDRYIATIVPQKAVSTHRAHIRHLTHWKERIGHKRLEDITSSYFSEWRDGLITQGLQNTTINRYVAIVRHLFSVCVDEWEWLEVSPLRRIKDLKEHDGRTRYLTKEEVSRLLTVCKTSQNSRLHLLVTLALGTGARKNELLHVRYCDIQTQSGLITYRETKNGSTRSVALTGVALSTVRNYLTQHPDIPTALIFARESNLAVPMSFRDAWERAVRRAQLTDVCFHTLRHTCGSHLAMSGASLLDISVVLGHHNIQMSKRYSHLSPGHLAGVVEKMNKNLLS